ncbi:MAG: AbrB/MazE/SpoVT family DNA-binding domain-containing protein [Methylococcales bacterium]
MKTIKLSIKGQVIIPKIFRKTHRWNPGLELQITEMADGILLQPKAAFERTNLDDVAGSLIFPGKVKTQEEIDSAMKQAATEAWRGSY